MPAGFGVSLRELAWWSLNVLHQQRPPDTHKAQSKFFKSSLFRTNKSNRASVELLRQMHQTSLCLVHLTWFFLFWCFGGGQYAQFNPTTGSNDAPSSPLLSAGGSFFVSPSRLCHSAAAAPSRLPLPVCSVSLVPERPAALVQPALQWRLSGPGDLRWGVPLFTQAARAHPSPPKRARAWPNTWACVRILMYFYIRLRVCVRDSAQAQMSEWVGLGLKEWVIQLHNRSQLLPAPRTADCCGRHELINATSPFTLSNAAVLTPHDTVRVSDSFPGSPL